jgi:glycosyltransferase involved in cell wall biosynthesis
VKPLLLSTYDLAGGAARSAYRLHKGLQAIGVDSRMMVQTKSSDDPTVIDASVFGPTPLWIRGISHLRRRIDNRRLAAYPGRDRANFSPAFGSDFFPQKVAAARPDIVHLHWVAGDFLRIENLSKFGKPIVWSLHDMWAFTGGCHYDASCGRYVDRCGACPQLHSQMENDLSRSVWMRKEKSWAELPITVVTPSRWLADCAKASSLFRSARVEVIPYGLDLEIYRPSDRNVAREILNLPRDKRLILFGAVKATGVPRKGFGFLQSALNKLSKDAVRDNTALVVFGASRPPDEPDLKFETHFMGRVQDDVHLALIYSAADVFVAPSLQDNLPNTVMESLACGTPVVAFDTGGIPDMIEHKANGYLAKALDPDDLAQGLEWILNDPERAGRLGAAGRKKALTEYPLSLQAERYLKLYTDLLAGSHENREPETDA